LRGSGIFLSLVIFFLIVLIHSGFLSFFYYKFFIRIYLLYGRERLAVTILIIIVHYFHQPRHLSPSPPMPLRAIARGFLALFHLGIWSPSTIHRHLNLLPSPSLPASPAHTMPILQSWFSLLIFKLTFKGVSQCMPSVGVLYFGLFNSFHYSPLPLYPPPPRVSTVFNTHPHILYLYIFFFLLFICAYNAWVTSPPCPHPLPYHPLHPLLLSPTPLYILCYMILLILCHSLKSLNCGLLLLIPSYIHSRLGGGDN
jgi:hypothetical protein